MDDLDTVGATVGFGNARLPPGYAVLRTDDHTHWVRLTDDGMDWTREGAIHWDRWASFRGAWNDYMQSGDE